MQTADKINYKLIADAGGFYPTWAGKIFGGQCQVHNGEMRILKKEIMTE